MGKNLQFMGNILLAFDKLGRGRTDTLSVIQFYDYDINFVADDDDDDDDETDWANVEAVITTSN